MTIYKCPANLFSKTIIARGRDYFKKGMVGELYNINSNIYAVVNNYKVQIGPSGLYCSCPYDDNCKHMYALKLKLEAEGEPDDLMLELGNLEREELLLILCKIIDCCVPKTIKILEIINDPSMNVDTDTDSYDSDD